MEEKLFNLSNKIGKIKGYCNLDNGIYIAEWQGVNVKSYADIGKMHFEAETYRGEKIACFIRFRGGEGEIFEIKEK